MAIENENPVTIPARDALTADKIAVDRMTLDRHGNNWSASATVVFYADTESGPVYARDDDGQLTTDTVSTQDVFATAAELPAVGAAVLAIQDAVVAMRNKKMADLAAEKAKADADAAEAAQ